MRATAARRAPPIGDLTKRTFPHGRVRVLSLRRPLEEDISLGQDRAVPASAWRKEMTYLPVCPPSSLRGNRTARPDHRSGFPCNAGHEEEGRTHWGEHTEAATLQLGRRSTSHSLAGERRQEHSSAANRGATPPRTEWFAPCPGAGAAPTKDLRTDLAPPRR